MRWRMKFKKGDLVWFEQPTIALDSQEWSHNRIPEVIYEVLPGDSYTLSPTSLAFPEEMFTPRSAEEPTPCWSCNAEPFGTPRSAIAQCPHCKQDIPVEPLIPGRECSQQLDPTCWDCMGQIHCHICGADHVSST